ncbi:hypothetical protein RB195_019976 [Necator americanus]|uniref:AMP-binding enzyme n=1 Tax=Necator americanus TaxID=51031 RepID=A0ABR1CK66_NECAM
MRFTQSLLYSFSDLRITTSSKRLTLCWKRLQPTVVFRSSHRRYNNEASNIIKSDYPSVPIPSSSFSDVVLDAVKSRINSKRIAFICAENNKEVNYKTVNDSAFALATFLRKNGFYKDIASAILPNQWEWLSVFLGVTLNGGTLTSISPVSTEYELQRHLLDCKAKLVFTGQQSLKKVLKATQQSSDVKIIICLNNDQTLPSGTHRWTDVLETTPDWNITAPAVDVDRDPVFMPYSSGTTGEPKGVMLTHRNYCAMMNIFMSHNNSRMTGAVNPPLDREKDKLLLLLPFYHCYGFGLLMDAVLNDFTSVHMSHFQPELFCQSIQKYGIRFLAVAPPILSFLARNPICERYDLSFLNTLLNGAAPLQKDVCDELVSKYKNIKHICQGYGMSEICMASHLPDLISGQPFGSVGKLASNMEMKIVDPETGIAKKRGELGEICIRGPTVMYGYFGKPEMTQKCIKDGWMYTGDIGYVDDDGYLFIVDRLKELIKVKGFQVSPTELERILQAHPLISDAAVVGVPDSIKGELPKAFVIRKSDNLSAEEVKSFLKEKVSPYKQLSGGVEFVEEIPKLPSGKVLRRLLRERSKSK